MPTQCPKCNSENPDTKQFCGDCGTQLIYSKDIPSHTRTLITPPPELRRGTTIASRYEIIEELGEGGMGKVYRVDDTKIQEEVALKLIRPEIAADKKTIQRFSNELKVARNISHKNICRMYHIDEHEGSHFITMEYVAGEDLKSLIRRVKQIHIGTAISIAKQVCDGLAAAHDLGVVHRDLKPSNIMIDKQGNARIMDFGIARSSQVKGITREGAMIGTPEYMSPEQVETKEVDHLSDLYSLGVILFEMVTGNVPFEGETPLSVARKHADEPPPDPKSLNPQISNDLNNLILKCLEKDRDNRYQNAKELRSELESIEKGIPTTARDIPKIKSLTAREITVQFSLKKLFVPVSLLFVLIMAAVLIWKFLPKKEATPPPTGKHSLAVMYFENNTDQEDFENMLLMLLTTNLSRFDGIEVVSPQRLFDILRQIDTQETDRIDRSVATEVARHAKVKTMLLGSIMKIGEKINIVANLTDVHSGSIVGSEQVEGTKEDDIFRMVDMLTESIGKQLGVFPGEKSKEIKIADATTDSFEAFQHYQKGIENVWHRNNDKAKECFQKAIEIDNTFASAYLWLAIAESNLEGGIIYWALNPYQNLTKVKKILALANKYAHDISERERLLLESTTHWFNHDMNSLYRQTQKFVEKYPKDNYAHFYLCQAALAKLDFDQAKESCERIIELNPLETSPYSFLGIICAFKKDYPCMQSAAEKSIAFHPDSYFSYLNSWISYAIARRFDEALSYLVEGIKKSPNNLYMQRCLAWTDLMKGETNEVLNKFPSLEDYDSGLKHMYFWHRGHSFLVEGKHKEANLEFKKAVELVQSAREQIIEFAIFATIRDLGKILVVQGEYEAAIQEFKKIEKTSEKDTRKEFNPDAIEAKYLIGMALAKKGDHEAVRDVASELALMVKDQNLENSHMNYYYLLMGELHVAERNYQSAQDCLDSLTGHIKLSSPHYWKLRAETYALMGEWDNAIEAYSNFYSNFYLTAFGWGNYFDFWRERSMVDYNLAKIYEKKNEPAKAIEHYEKFLDLMKNADPGIAEVDDARERLAELLN
jgi:serine/threonine protein kinase/Flp pilus assembly protein TadD